MSSSRERLRSRRRSPWRVVVIVLAILLLLAGVGTGLAVWLLPPVLSETPRERFEAPTRVTVSDARGAASVEFGAGWLGIGVGPFLPEDKAVVVSPDDVYRAELSLTAGGEFDGAAVLRERGLLTEEGDASEGAAGGGATPAAGAADGEAAGAADGGVAEVAWSTETLASGVLVHHTEFDRDGTTTVVAVAEPTQPVAGAGAALVLVVELPAEEAPAYRTVTADLLATATFSAPGTATPASPVATGVS